MDNKVIKLSRRYEAHDKVFDSVTVREPRWNDIMELGEPYEKQFAGGSMVVIENTDVIASYAKRMIVEPGHECLGALGVSDTRAVRGAVIDFFLSSDPGVTT